MSNKRERGAPSQLKQGAPHMKRQHVGLQVETRAKFRARHQGAAKSIFRDIVVVDHVCRCIGSVADLVHFSMCNKELYARVRRIYPDLARLSGALTSDFGRVRWVTRTLPDLDKLLAEGMHPLLWDWFCRMSLGVLNDTEPRMTVEERDSLRITYHVQAFAHSLVRCGRPELFLSFMQLLNRLGRQAYDIMGEFLFLLPEIQLFWGFVSLEAARQVKTGLVEAAAVQLMQYIAHPDRFNVAWYKAALDSPDGNAERAAIGGHMNYVLWIEVVYMPLLRSISKEMAERNYLKQEQPTAAK